ncbi:MAG: hypothetical protein J6584_07120 [Lactobacillus sp.]|jgi:hypothetical protein|nr:hypothetical protein [Candidatus Schmidhempelia sp.]MCO6543717.1 hypothetical protein [Lactobacillus sp.]
MTEKIGLGAFRKNKTQRPEQIAPEQSVLEERTLPQNILEHSKRRLASKDLPKSIRLPLDTHSAISTIANIENKKMHEVVTDIVEEYIQHLPPQNKKLIRNNVEAIKKSSN